MTNCLSTAELHKFLQGTLSDAESAPLIDHVESCADCTKELERIDCVALPAQALEGNGSDFGTERQFLKMMRNLQAGPLNSLVSRSGDTLVGQTLRDYELLHVLGQGGMGTVYRARHVRLNKHVAVKVLSGVAADEAAKARFQREMQSIGQLEHSNVVRALDAGEAEGQIFLVMECIDGIDLSAVIRNGAQLAIADACEICRQAATGLQYAHEKGLVHRDVKPSNLMLARTQSESVCVKVMDLGLALTDISRDEDRPLTDDGQLMGTLEFMAPEQAEDTHTVDERADIYSLGATLYRLLTGHLPFSGSEYRSPAKRLRALTTSLPPCASTLRADIPPELIDLLDRMLSTLPEYRPSHVRDVAEVLAKYSSEHQLPELIDRSSSADEIVSPALVDTAPSIADTLVSVGSGEPPNDSDKRRFSWRRGIPAGLLALLAFAVIRLQTDGGYLQIEADPSVNLTVDVLQNGTRRDSIQINPQAKEVWFHSGEYEIRLPTETVDSFAIEGGAFEMVRNGKPVLKITKLADFDSNQAKPNNQEAVTEKEAVNIITVSSEGDNGPGSVRQAIADASPGTTIRFHQSLNKKTIRLTSGTLQINKNLTIDAGDLSALTFHGNGRSRVIYAHEHCRVHLKGLTLTGGNGDQDANSGGGAVRSRADLTLTRVRVVDSYSPSDGGGVHQNGGSLTLIDTSISGNAANRTGGVAVWDSVCDFRNCTFANNSAETRGGALAMHLGTDLRMSNCTLTGNKSDNAAAILYNQTRASLSHCTLVGNIGTDSETSACLNADGQSRLKLHHCILADNSSVASDLRIATRARLIANSRNLVGVLAARHDIEFLHRLGSDDEPIELQLSPLADYGGNVPTMPPQADSFVIDACAEADAISDFDARGSKRPVDGNRDGTATADLGAVEFNPDIDPGLSHSAETGRRVAAKWMLDRRAEIHLTTLGVIRHEDDLPESPFRVEEITLKRLTKRDAPAAAERIARFPECSTLFLGDDSIDPFGDLSMESIGTLTNLKTLTVGTTGVTDAGIQHFQMSNRLERLQLQDMSISANALEHVRRSFPNLKSLSLRSGIRSSNREGKLDANVLTPIPRMKQLEILEMHVRHLPLNMLQPLARSSLKQLSIRHPIPFSKPFAAVIARMPHLNSFSADGGGVSDEGLMALAGCKSLQQLQISGNPEISTDGVRKLTQQRSDVNITITNADDSLKPLADLPRVTIR